MSEAQIERGPGWGRRVTARCAACGIFTIRHCLLPAGLAVGYKERISPDLPTAMETPAWGWIALWPVPLPANVFADDEVFHLSQGIACPGAHHRDYGTAYIAHDAACPGLHTTAPVTSRGAAVLWRRANRRLRRAEL